jgi:hypothetical protein
MAAGMFSQCPRLRTCRLVINDDTDSAAVSESVLELPSVLALDIHSFGVPVNRTGGLFSRISLPQAGHLSLQGFMAPHHPDTFTYFHFPAITPRLESLVLETHLFSKHVLVDLLRGLPPTIRELQLTGRDGYPSLLDDDALTALTPSPDRHPFGCLNLQRLQLLYCHDVSDQALLRFIQARMGSSTREDQPATLRVEARFVREMQLDIGPEIQPFLDAGLRFDTTHAPAPELTLRLSPWLGQDVSEELPT